MVMGMSTAWGTVFVVVCLVTGLEPQENAAALYQCAMMEAFWLDGGFGGQKVSAALQQIGTQQASEAERLMRQTDRIAWLVCQAARYPRCSWPIRHQGPVTILEQHQQARRIVRIILGRIRYLTAQKQHAQAFEECLACLRLIERVQEPQFLLTHIISAVLFGQWCEAVTECAPHWSVKERQAIIRALQLMRVPNPPGALLEEERELSRWLLEEMRKGIAGRRRLQELEEYLGPMAYMVAWLPEPVLGAAAERCRETLQEFCSSLNLPVGQFRAAYNQWKQRVREREREPITGMLLRQFRLTENRWASPFGYDFRRRIRLRHELLILGLRAVDEGRKVCEGVKSQVTGKPINYRPTRYGFVLETDLPLADEVSDQLGGETMLLQFGHLRLRAPENDQDD